MRGRQHDFLVGTGHPGIQSGIGGNDFRIAEPVFAGEIDQRILVNRGMRPDLADY